MAYDRELIGLISRHEKPILIYLANRIPAGIHPDHMTAIGIAGAACSLAGFVLSYFGAGWLLLSVLGLIVNWVGDSLDGTLARIRSVERPRYGFFVDHMTDVASQALVIIGLGLSPYMRLDVACLVFAAYLVMTIFTLLRLHVRQTFCLSYYGVGPTELRVLLIAGIVLALVLGPATLVTPYGVVGLYDTLAGIFVAVAAISTFRLARNEARALAPLDRGHHDLRSQTVSRYAAVQNGHLVLAAADGRVLTPHPREGVTSRLFPEAALSQDRT
jgi:phosphatidylglycerophosphate synthase